MTARATTVTALREEARSGRIRLEICRKAKTIGDVLEAFLEHHLTTLEACASRIEELERRAAVCPGWFCASCRMFNGSGKEELTACRACGKVRVEGPAPWEGDR